MVRRTPFRLQEQHGLSVIYLLNFYEFTEDSRGCSSGIREVQCLRDFRGEVALAPFISDRGGECRRSGETFSSHIFHLVCTTFALLFLLRGEDRQNDTGIQGRERGIRVILGRRRNLGDQLRHSRCPCMCQVLQSAAAGLIYIGGCVIMGDTANTTRILQVLYTSGSFDRFSTQLLRNTLRHNHLLLSATCSQWFTYPTGGSYLTPVSGQNRF